MHPWRQLVRGWRNLTRREDADRDIDDELAHWLERSAAQHVRDGLPPDAAQRAARVEFGSLASATQQVRGYGWERTIEALAADVRHALRRPRVEPAFAVATTFTLALAIGAATAIVSAAKPTLFDPLPYPDAHRIVAIRELRPDGAENGGTFGMYREFAARARSLEALAVARPWQPTLTGSDRPERLEGQRVSARYFDVLGVAPRIGRSFLGTEDQPNGDAVVVLSDLLWRQRFDADAAIIGRPIRLDDQPFTVIGVMPPGFEDVAAPSAGLWTTLQYDMTQGRAWGHHLRTVARQRGGATLEEASRELNTLGAAVLAELKPETYGPEVRMQVVPLQEALTRGVRPVLLAMLGAVTLLLVIACVNVVSLALARDARRHADYALRVALGVGRRRLARQLLAESAVLATAGGVLGLAIAWVGVRALVVIAPASLPRAADIDLDTGVFAFAFLLTAVVGLVVGLVPAWRATRVDPQDALQAGTRRSAPRRRVAGQVLVAAQVALALTLLVCSGLLLRSVSRLSAVEPGLDAEGLLSMQVQVSGQRFADGAAAERFFEQALEAVRATRGVGMAAFTSQLPLSGEQDLYGARFEPDVAADPGEDRGTFRYAVSAGYFEAMRIPLRRGRLLDARDVAGAPAVAVISEALARRRLPGVDPIGQRLRLGPAGPYRIVGVVGDVRQLSLAVEDAEAVYIPSSQWAFADRVRSLVVRGTAEGPVDGSAVRDAIWSVDRDQPIVRTATMASLVAASGADRRFALVVFEVFALAALFLAGAGLYGLLAGSVAERAQEIGVRMAMGARRGSILSLVIGQGMGLALAGAVFGVVGATWATRGIAALLFGVTPLDLPTWVGVTAAVLTTAFVACLVPALRAVRIDPANTLRG